MGFCSHRVIINFMGKPFICLIEKEFQTLKNDMIQIIGASENRDSSLLKLITNFNISNRNVFMMKVNGDIIFHHNLSNTNLFSYLDARGNAVYKKMAELRNGAVRYQDKNKPGFVMSYFYTEPQLKWVLILEASYLY